MDSGLEEGAEICIHLASKETPPPSPLTLTLTPTPFTNLTLNPSLLALTILGSLDCLTTDHCPLVHTTLYVS